MALKRQSLGSSPEEQSGMHFQEMLLNIDSNLTAQDVEGLKFLCTGLVFEKRLESCSSALDLFDLLLVQELFREDDPFFLAELLYVIKQHALLSRLGYTRESVEQQLPARGRLSLFR